jgi:hypothetical protein
LEGLLTTHANPRALLDHGLAQWSELVDFEVYPVISSAQRPNGLHRDLGTWRVGLSG